MNKGWVSKRNLVVLALLLVGWFALTSCGAGGPNVDVTPTATLPAPQVRIGLLPTVTPEPEIAAPLQESTETPSPAPQPQVQAWPTLDEEAYLLGLIDGMIEKIERRLNNTNTEIKP